MIPILYKKKLFFFFFYGEYKCYAFAIHMYYGNGNDYNN